MRLRAEQSAARIQAMLEEVAAENAQKKDYFMKSADMEIIDALQRLWYGVAFELPLGAYHQYFHAIMSVAGNSSSRPTQWLKDRTLLLGLTDDETNELLRKDCRSLAVEPVLVELDARAKHLSNDSIHHLLFYDALTMASQAQFWGSLDEHLRASRFAQMLRLSEDNVDSIHALVKEEDALRKRKIDLFCCEDADGDGKEGNCEKAERCHPKQQSEALDARRDALQRLTYGMAVPRVAQRKDHYVQVLLSVAGAEGVITKLEQEWLRDRCTAGAKLAHMPETVAVAVLLDAVTMASQDAAITEARKARAHEIALQLGLVSEICDEIIDIVLIEKNLQDMKRNLFRRRDVDAEGTLR